MIELSGNIKLINFDSIEPALLIVVKKVVGNYTRKISEAYNDFKSIEVSIEDAELNKIRVRVEVSETIIEKEAHDENLFFALDKALAAVLKQ